MTPHIRKLALTVHITASVGWLGALGVFFAHALAMLVSEDQQVARASSLAMGLTAWLVILPLSMATVVTGLVQALGTAWGLVRHYWVLFKLVLTAIATGVLLLKMGPITLLAEAASTAAFARGDLLGLRQSLAFHAAGGLVVLLAALVLAVYKPAGLTVYGARKQGETTPLGMPRWAKAFGVLLIVVSALVLVMALFGAHGPRVH